MNLETHLKRQRKFSKRSFGPGQRTRGVLDHIRKELKEIERNPFDLEEWVDVITLACDGAWRAGHSPRQIAKALSAKLAKNEKRKWPNWKDADENHAIEHLRGTQCHSPNCGPCSTKSPAGWAMFKPFVKTK